jgi:hypothetical protein
MQLCNGNPHSQCWMQNSVSFSFSFKTQGLSQLGAYVKLLFWTDAGNIFGLLPPAHPEGGGKFRLIAFPSDNYPTSWKHEAEIEDDKWFHLQIDFSPSTQAVVAYLNGAKLGDASIPVNMLEVNNSPQIGVYSYDSSNKSWPAGFALWLHDMCIGEASGICLSGNSSIEGRPASGLVMPLPTALPATMLRLDPTPEQIATTKRVIKSTAFAAAAAASTSVAVFIIRGVF